MSLWWLPLNESSGSDHDLRTTPLLLGCFVPELNLSYHKPKTICFTMYPYSDPGSRSHVVWLVYIYIYIYIHTMVA